MLEEVRSYPDNAAVVFGGIFSKDGQSPCEQRAVSPQQPVVHLEKPAVPLQQPPTVPPLSEVAAGKRPAVTFEDEEDSNADEFAGLEGNSASPLPDTQHRVSGRMRKRSRLLDGYIV
ncbi:hypothetical protein N7522_006243 [Penicillium canescens]|nr:hypothetical protein N7522_006243 [Penicillium canescens]